MSSDCFCVQSATRGYKMAEQGRSKSEDMIVRCMYSLVSGLVLLLGIQNPLMEEPEHSHRKVKVALGMRKLGENMEVKYRYAALKNAPCTAGHKIKV